VQAGSARGAQIGDPWDRLDRLVCSEGLTMQCHVSNKNSVHDEEYNYTDHHCHFSKSEHPASSNDNQKINRPRLQINFKQQEVNGLEENKVTELTYISSSPKIITFVTGDYEIPQVISLAPIRGDAGHDLFVWSSATSFSYSTIGPDGTQRYLQSSYYLSRYTCYPE
jgi:hypothetical protein